MSARSVVLIAVLALLGVGASVTWQQLLAPRISAAEEHLKARTWLSVLPAGSYDNEPLRQPLTLPDPQLAQSTLLGGYLATLAGKPTAVVLHSRVQGYAGPIQLLIAIGPDGRVISSHVLQHQETPGLGARLTEPGNRWLQGFDGHSQANTPEAAWALKRDNGRFDQLAGASVTSRAVIHAIQDALRYFDEHAQGWLTEGPAHE
ncbi:RnfABCDGE type electron transport complex subunit G [Pseudomonas sp. Marseille-P9899]|uniref:RnfABCDGE type electron transport complex subunit G n=1 Tax=Pseudomonas sp. Marseille-P9899 TaxID=2730401 RepID=UPI00158A0C9A|nr:RnfABCDGE type electron transport complex subunit G [Pseudomonas sp. Marseille-P9899]